MPSTRRPLLVPTVTSTMESTGMVLGALAADTAEEDEDSGCLRELWGLAVTTPVTLFEISVESSGGVVLDKMDVSSSSGVLKLLSVSAAGRRRGSTHVLAGRLSIKGETEVHSRLDDSVFIPPDEIFLMQNILHNGVRSPLLQYDWADRCFVTTARRTPIYPRGGTWVRAEGSNPQIVAHQQLVSYYQRHPPAHPEDVFTILRIDVEPTQTAESVQSPINEQPLELPEVQYVPIEILDIELPPAPPAPTNTPVKVPMATFTQEDIDQRITVALAAYQSQQSTANRPLRLDIPAPEPFSGKAEDLRRFVQCILSYFVATNNTRLSDEAKIAFTVALMRKDLGKTWADAYYKKSTGGVQVYSTWADFVTALEEAFPEHRMRIKAHQILMKLPERQKDRKSALSLGNYVTRFKQLASKAQLKDAEVNGTNRVENDYHTLHANFVKGLPKELYFALATRVTRDRPNTMKAWYDEV
ncbi:predicted protein [Postia placenta Mad-698-R]|uniref:DUF4939 domain-containing protein n=1 Tax=Postia placenta MAD-698-R-SB12 TaxID=670580 RepID=A0A1X6N3A7_9APHY|nr:hypothetical protein POSPLADRAFT_1140970 [Postia placenta MAD-698-R-SB12]EED84226.1 predicted protein [Postia placenta Mad-698-R]OSX63107.1 hypothetical protein POSPLADRAFT_1140970 [Postia placenta MAD-698-R-SB12]